MSELPDDILELQQLAFRYFLDHTNARNGLVADNTREESPCSITATGLGLSCYPVAVNNGWLKRADAAERVLTALRFFEHSAQVGDRRRQRPWVQPMQKQQLALVDVADSGHQPLIEQRVADGPGRRYSRIVAEPVERGG